MQDIPSFTEAWLTGSTLVSYVVTLRRARLILGWVTVCGHTISVCNQPPMSTQPSISAG